MMMGSAAMPAIASSPAGASVAPIVNITYAPVINAAGSADEFEKSAEKHARALTKIVKEQLARELRVKF